mmetsp:Transcript_24608/g.53752  ORF Transcript_24608/g.53752 Transcript_24608/m.53752 type:complete len:200 (+) Transcript_24608:177-776(+)
MVKRLEWVVAPLSTLCTMLLPACCGMVAAAAAGPLAAPPLGTPFKLSRPGMKCLKGGAISASSPLPLGLSMPAYSRCTSHASTRACTLPPRTLMHFGSSNTTPILIGAFVKHIFVPGGRSSCKASTRLYSSALQVSFPSVSLTNNKRRPPSFPLPEPDVFGLDTSLTVTSCRTTGPLITADAALFTSSGKLGLPNRFKS